MRFTNEKEAFEHITTEGLAIGKFDEAELKAWASEIAESIPPSTKMAYAPADMQDNVIVLAANYLPTYQGQLNIDAPAAGNAVVETQATGVAIKAGKNSAEIPEPQYSDEQTEAVKKLLSANLDKKQALTAATKIKNILVRAPKPSEMYKGITLEPKDDKNMLATYADVLVGDDIVPGNKAAYDKAVEAVKSGKKVAPYFNDKSRKYMGVTVETLDTHGEGASKKVDKILTNDNLVGFLTFEVLCRIPSVDDLGVELKGIKAAGGKNRKAETGKAQGVPNIKWDGKTAVIAAGDPNRVVAISQIKKGEFKKGTLQTELAFKVYKVKRDANGEIGSYETNQKGERLTRLIRVRGTSDKLPVLERIPAYVKDFSVEKSGTTIYASMSMSEQIAAVKTATDFISRMGSEAQDTVFFGYKEMLAAVEEADTASAANSYA